MDQTEVQQFVTQHAPERAGALNPAPQSQTEVQAWYNAVYPILLAEVERFGGSGFGTEQVASKHRFGLVVQDHFSWKELRSDAKLLAQAQAAWAAGTATLEQYIRATIQCNLWDSEIRNARIWYREIRVGDRVRVGRGRGMSDTWSLNGRDIDNQAGAISAYRYAEYRRDAVETVERDGGRQYRVLVVL